MKPWMLSALVALPVCEMARKAAGAPVLLKVPVWTVSTELCAVPCPLTAKLACNVRGEVPFGLVLSLKVANCWFG
jgi:hypothetical protein